MASKIQWTDATWNPIIGCSKVSAGCLNCYAEKMAGRLWHMQKEDGGYYKDLGCYNGKWTGKTVFVESALEKPLHWKKPRMIFVCSMGDIFHESVDICWLTHIFDVIKACPQHTFQILTKRPENALKMMWGKHGTGWRYFGDGDFHPNVWLGTTCENQEMTDKRIPILLQIPATKRFISVEPMLGPVDINRDYNGGKHWGDLLDWCIVGAESGPKRRFLKDKYVLDIVNQCQEAEIPVFVKQLHDDVTKKLIKSPEGWPREYPERISHE